MCITKVKYVCTDKSFKITVIYKTNTRSVSEVGFLFVCMFIFFFFVFFFGGGGGGGGGKGLNLFHHFISVIYSILHVSHIKQ